MKLKLGFILALFMMTMCMADPNPQAGKADVAGNAAGAPEAGRVKGAIALKNSGRAARSALTPSPLSVGDASGTP